MNRDDATTTVYICVVSEYVFNLAREIRILKYPVVVVFFALKIESVEF